MGIVAFVIRCCVVSSRGGTFEGPSVAGVSWIGSSIAAVVTVVVVTVLVVVAVVEEQQVEHKHKSLSDPSKVLRKETFSLVWRQGFCVPKRNCRCSCHSGQLIYALQFRMVEVINSCFPSSGCHGSCSVLVCHEAAQTQFVAHLHVVSGCASEVQIVG